MYKFLETLLLTIVSYSILLVFIWIWNLVFFILNDIVEKAVAIGFVLIFIVIFVVIYHL